MAAVTPRSLVNWICLKPSLFFSNPYAITWLRPIQSFASLRTIYGIRYSRALHWNEGYGVRGRMSGRLYPPEERRSETRDGRDAVHRSGRVHRLRRVRAGLPRVGDLRLG